MPPPSDGSATPQDTGDRDGSDSPDSPPGSHPPAGPDGADGSAVAARRRPSTVGGVIYLVVLAATVAGLVVVAVGPWRTGTRILAGALLFGGLMRAVIPAREAGMLAIRSRWFDTTLLAVSGAAIWFLAGSIPDA